MNENSKNLKRIVYLWLLTCYSRSITIIRVPRQWSSLSIKSIYTKWLTLIYILNDKGWLKCFFLTYNNLYKLDIFHNCLAFNCKTKCMLPGPNDLLFASLYLNFRIADRRALCFRFWINLLKLLLFIRPEMSF